MATTSSQLNTYFPTELVAKTWSFLTVVNLLRYAMTSKINYHDVHNAIRDTVLHILGLYFENPVGFLSKLGK